MTIFFLSPWFNYSRLSSSFTKQKISDQTPTTPTVLQSSELTEGSTLNKLKYIILPNTRTTSNWNDQTSIRTRNIWELQNKPKRHTSNWSASIHLQILKKPKEEQTASIPTGLKCINTIPISKPIYEERNFLIILSQSLH